MEIKICPSILSADFSKLGDECRDVLNGGANWIHFDVMDGSFVPNLTVGIPVLKSLSQSVNAFYDVHLMINHPEKYAADFAAAGADMITFHAEVGEYTDKVIDEIKSRGIKAGVALRPFTPIEWAYPFVEKCDMILLMTVEPGFGGQKFMPSVCEKIAALRKYADSIGRTNLLIEVDGGITAETVIQAASAGADTFVAGSSVFGKADRRQAVADIRKAAEESYRKGN